RPPAAHARIAWALFCHHHLGEPVCRGIWIYPPEDCRLVHEIRVDLQRRYRSGPPRFMVSTEFFNISEKERHGGNSSWTPTTTNRYALSRCIKMCKLELSTPSRFHNTRPTVTQLPEQRFARPAPSSLLAARFLVGSLSELTKQSVAASAITSRALAA